MAWIEVVIEEYKTLREESLTAMQLQQAVLRYGVAIVGLLTVTAFHLWSDRLLSGAVLFVFVPLVSYLILIIWMGEVARMMRVGWFLRELEDKINKHFPNNKPALTWENFLRDKSGHQTPQLNWNYFGIIGLFLSIPVATIILGNVRLWQVYDAKTLLFFNVSEAIVFAAVFIRILVSGQRFR